jgi:hypothetical protein
MNAVTWSKGPNTAKNAAVAANKRKSKAMQGLSTQQRLDARFERFSPEELAKRLEARRLLWDLDGDMED